MTRTLPILMYVSLMLANQIISPFPTGATMKEKIKLSTTKSIIMMSYLSKTGSRILISNVADKVSLDLLLSWDLCNSLAGRFQQS